MTPALLMQTILPCKEAPSIWAMQKQVVRVALPQDVEKVNCRPSKVNPECPNPQLFGIRKLLISGSLEQMFFHHRIQLAT